MAGNSTLSTLAQNTTEQSLFQPDAVDRSYGGFDVKLANSSDWARRDLLIEAHQEWKTRIEHITRIMTGDWWRVWPDLTREPLAPTVANTIEMATSHMAAIGALWSHPSVCRCLTLSRDRKVSGALPSVPVG